MSIIPLHSCGGETGESWGKVFVLFFFLIGVPIYYTEVFVKVTAVLMYGKLDLSLRLPKCKDIALAVRQPIYSLFMLLSALLFLLIVTIYTIMFLAIPVGTLFIVPMFLCGPKALLISLAPTVIMLLFLLCKKICSGRTIWEIYGLDLSRFNSDEYNPSDGFWSAVGTISADPSTNNAEGIAAIDNTPNNSSSDSMTYAEYLADQTFAGEAKLVPKKFSGDEIRVAIPISEEEIATNSTQSLLKEIERLGDLKERGLLTEDEFLRAKEKILAMLRER